MKNLQQIKSFIKEELDKLDRVKDYLSDLEEQAWVEGEIEALCKVFNFITGK